MGDNIMLVYCGKAKCLQKFEMPLSNIKEIDQFKHPILYEKYKCPFCGKKHKDYFDPTVNPIKVREEIAAKNLEQERQKAAQPISCPSCHSTQFYASDKGFSSAKALIGGAALGGIGLLAGFHGSKKVMLTCLKCGHKWKAGN